MGFIQTLKNKFGIGGVKVTLHAPGQVSKELGIITGKVVLTSKSDQEVTVINVSLKETYTTGRGDDKKTTDFTLGQLNLPANFLIKSGETKEIPYELKFTMVKSDNDSLKEKGGALGKLGSMAAFANNEKSEYSVEANADVKSAVLDPSDSVAIKLV